MTEQNSGAEGSVESDKIVTSGGMGSRPVQDRRRHFRRLLALAGLGITGVLLSRDKNGLLPAVTAFGVTSGVNTNATFEVAVFDGLDDVIGNAGFTWDAAGGLKSTATNGGLQGTATGPDRIGVYGVANGTAGTGVEGTGSAVGLQGLAGNTGAIPIVALGVPNQAADLQQWGINFSSTPLSVVDANGNFGIGTSTPQSHLFVVDSTTNPTRGIVASQNNSGAQAALMQMTKSRGTESSPSAVANGDYVGAFNMNAYDGTSYLGGKPMAGWGAKVNGAVSAGSIPTDLFFYTKPSGTLDPYADNVVRFIIASNGNIYANGSLLSSSDMRLKTDIEPIDNALEKVLALNGVYFHWDKDANQPDGRQVGVIAQNVQQVLPEIVSTSPATKDYLSVDYTRLVPVLIQAIKEQQEQFKQQQRTIEHLEKQNEQFQKRLQELES